MSSYLPSIPAMRSIVVATTNKGKLVELRRLFAKMTERSPLLVQLFGIDDIFRGKRIEIVEDGLTFEANALKKARTLAKLASIPALADDSGLEVDALGGAPGVRSARYAGERATDAENNRKLLDALAALGPKASRTARFRCTIALVDPTGDAPLLGEGSCEGEISATARGAGGFGYDPIFLVRDRPGRTMAELSDDDKNAVSHRAAAIAALEPKLRAWYMA